MNVYFVYKVLTNRVRALIIAVGYIDVAMINMQMFVHDILCAILTGLKGRIGMRGRPGQTG